MRGKLRKKKLKNGKLSLYIDYFPPVWNPAKRKYTRREFLDLHIYPNPVTSLEKKENQLYSEIAEKIYLKRMKLLMLDANGIYNKDVLEGDFLLYCTNFIRAKKKDKIDTKHYETALKYLKRWVGDHFKFRHIDDIFLETFKEYLLTSPSLKSKKQKLDRNSAASYYDKMALMVEQAFLDKYLPENYTLRVGRITNVRRQRQIIDDDELKLLLDNRIDDELVFKSSMFALLTGFRFSALKILRWSDFHFSQALNSWYVYFIDPKPERSFKQYISFQAMNIIGPKQDNDDLVFTDLSYSRTREKLKEWFSSVGLRDKAKFHNWRHKYATDLIEKGEDIYVVSKMLNHQHIKTTEIYTRVPDTNRAKAASKAVYKHLN